jgi:hypothetical protein
MANKAELNTPVKQAITSRTEAGTLKGCLRDVPDHFHIIISSAPARFFD